MGWGRYLGGIGRGLCWLCGHERRAELLCSGRKAKFGKKSVVHVVLVLQPPFPLSVCPPILIAMAHTGAAQDLPKKLSEGQRARAIPRTSLESDKMESLISAQPFFGQNSKATRRQNQSTAPKQTHLHAEGGNSDENGACNLRSPTRDNFGGLQGCAPMVVCLGGFLVWACGSVAFWWLVPLVAGTQPLVRGRPSSGTDPASCTKTVGLQPYLISTTASHHAVSERCILHLCLSVRLGQLSLPGGFLFHSLNPA